RTDPRESTQNCSPYRGASTHFCNHYGIFLRGIRSDTPGTGRWLVNTHPFDYPMSPYSESMQRFADVGVMTTELSGRGQAKYLDLPTNLKCSGLCAVNGQGCVFSSDGYLPLRRW